MTQTKADKEDLSEASHSRRLIVVSLTNKITADDSHDVALTRRATSFIKRLALINGLLA
ncbi:hypothetical protein I6N95_17625 [Vagococcus sp. BWB3-3]|uniref:Uncharacterized protein n=2 Tax=Vagococcus allomyrinae TaxID=2794353 RepID=A0A940SW09_9ENTE|nr:hypothetical protein [Vagococcus allomyrinae]